MPRSNAPLALSVVSVTIPGDIAATAAKLAIFDDRSFGFSHAPTWAAMPAALRGVINPASVPHSFGRKPKRIIRCIQALCELGRERPRETRRFSDFPESGLGHTISIDWGPNVTVRVKGSCWYIENGRPVLPILQPRKKALDDSRLGMYVRLAKQAYCQGDWLNAEIETIDLSGDDEAVVAVTRREKDICLASNDEIALFVNTYIEAKKLVDAKKGNSPRPERPSPMDELFGLKG